MTITEEKEQVAKPRSDAVFWAVMAGVIVLLVLGVVFFQRFGSDPSITASPLIGEPLPDVTVPYLEEPGEFSFTGLEGDIAVVNFWASWCFGCRQEHDALVAGAREYEQFDVTFVGVNYQDNSLERAVGFLDELGRSEQTIYVRDVGSRTALEFGVLGLPETFFVDRTGTIVGKVSGPVNAQLLFDTIDKILLGQTIGQVKTGEVENRSD